MSVDSFVYFLGVVITVLLLVVCFLVFVGWRKNVSDRKMIGFLIAQMFPDLLRKNAIDRKAREKMREGQKAKTSEITEALKESGIEMKPGETAMGAMKRWLSEDQIGNIAPRPEKE